MSESAVKLLIFYFWFITGAIAFSAKVVMDGNGELLYYLACLVAAVSFASFSRVIKNKPIEIVCLTASFTILFLMYGFRDVSAIDDPTYERIFHEVLSDGWFVRFKKTTMEPGYLMTNSLFGPLFGSYFGFQVFFSFVSLFLFYKAFYENRQFGSIDIAVFLLFCMLMIQMQSVALVRMFFAIAIATASYKHLVEGRPLRYVIAIIFATMFHYSAFFLVFLVYFAVNKAAFRRGMFLHYFLIAVAFPVLMVFIINYLLPILGERYQNYAYGKFGFDASFVNTLPFMFILLYFYNSKFRILGESRTLQGFLHADFYKLLLFVYSLSFLIFIFGGMANMGRLVFYAYASFIILVPMALASIRSGALYLIVSGIFVFYGYFYMYKTQFLNDHHLAHLVPVRNALF